MMKKRLLRVILLCVMGAVIVLSQTGKRDIYSYLDLEHPGLEKVKKAYARKDMKNAAKELLDYFQHRTNRKTNYSEAMFPVEIAEADEHVSNAFTFKAYRHEFGGQIDWTKVQMDNEWQFSLNRMDWFLNYAGVYERTHEEKYVRAWMRQFESWHKLGIPGYPRTIDTGRRLGSLVASYGMFVQKLQSKTVTPEFNAMILESMAEQAEFLFKTEHWRKYSNWGTFENSGFAFFAALFPEFKRNDEWLSEIFFRMRTQLQNSYYSDGMHIETAPSYHANELEVWFDFITLMELNHIEEPTKPQIVLPTYKELILPKAMALMHLHQPNGNLPQVSDTDEDEKNDLLSRIGEYWNVPELIYFTTSGKRGTPPNERSITFPEGGYTILRSGWGDKKLPFDQELYLLFDHGDNKPWHAHFDISNIVVSAYGYELLVDPGRYTYNQNSEREGFKSTAFHNTVVVDSKSQKRIYKSPPIEHYCFPFFDYVFGEHDANADVSHRRSIFFANKEYWIVVDRLSAEQEHTYEQWWHLSSRSFDRVIRDTLQQKIVAPHVLLYTSPLNTTSVEEGVVSPRYRHKQPAPVIRSRSAAAIMAVMPTVIIPYKDTLPEMTVNSSYYEIAGTHKINVSVTVTSNTFEDLYYERVWSGRMAEGGQLETDAKMVFKRSDKSGNVQQLQLLGGSYLKHQGKMLVEIKGSPVDIIMDDQEVRVTGRFVMAFALLLSDTRTYFVNGSKVSVERKNGKVVYQPRSDLYIDEK